MRANHFKYIDGNGMTKRHVVRINVCGDKRRKNNEANNY